MPFDALACPDWLCRSPLPSLWQAWLPDDFILRAAVYTALALALITLLVMVQVLLLAEVSARRQRRRQRFNDAWRPYFALCSLSDDAPEHPPLARGQRFWFVMQWNRTQLQLRGAARERMNRALQALGLEAYVLGLLQGRVRSRLVGLTCLRYLAEPRHWDAVQPLVTNRSAIVSLAAAQTLVAMDASRAMQLLLPLATTRRDWAMPRLSSLCQQAGTQAVTAPILTVLVGAEPSVRQRLVGLLSWAEPRHAAPWSRARLDDGGTGEELQAALECLCELGDPRDRERIVRALRHEDPGVRLKAIGAFRQQARATDAEVLLPLLADRSWWVRQATADALAALPGATPERLERLLDQVTDRYGQDALRRAIAEMPA
ncbi:HEAT repeat domain-containing protein [Stutzerimonas urumqiensis]|uniref:HEAT repeat domain-containing protein n=1 Tax=Stutzerimonas urumqiensis TaxID=638269 RepID=UPI003BA936C4